MKGKYFWDDDTGWKVSHPFIMPVQLPIAILTGNQTGSSGEAVVVSFIGNNHTKSFGQPTWGLTTGNGSFELQDGSQIFLASTVMADRNGNLYRGSMSPDVLVTGKSVNENDLALDTAIQWIKTQQKDH